MTRTRRAVLRSAVGGGAALGAAGTAAAQEGSGTRPDFGSWLDGVDGGFLDARGQEEVTVQVGAQGNQGNFAFAPAGLWVDPGTTVTWEWTGRGSQHNVRAVEGASFSSGDPVAAAGTTYQHTFSEAGIVNYQCDPHISLGMKGAVAVGDDVPTVQAGGDGGPVWTPPGGATGVALVGMLLGSAAIGVFSVLGADWYAERRRRKNREPGTTEEAAPTEPAVNVEHDEFDPVGTATLIAVYFLVLVVMWAFMYFVEFAGNGPSVIG
jgi:halocyanin-like protein